MKMILNRKHLAGIILTILTGLPWASVNGLTPDAFELGAAIGGVPGRYTEVLRSWISGKAEYVKSILDRWPSSLELNCLTTPEAHEYYIGIAQRMKIRAPLSDVVNVLDAIDSYEDLFPDFKDVRVVKKDQNRSIVFWEQRIPLFFVPNVKYEMIYQINSPSATRRVYRYQLNPPDHHVEKFKDTMIESDGMIVLDRISDTETRYFEIDFWDAHWGALKTFAPSRIWKDSVKGLILSDLAIQIRAENFSLSIKDAQKAAEKKFDADRLEELWVDPCVANKKPAKDFLKQIGLI